MRVASVIVVALLAAGAARADGELTAEQRRELQKKAVDLDREAAHQFEGAAYDKAAALQQEALDARRRLYPREQYPDGHPELATSLNSLGHLFWVRGEYARAEPLLREALAMRQRLYPRDRFPDGHADIARSLRDLGNLLQDQGHYAQAVTSFRDAVEMYRRLYPRDKFPDGHPDLAAALDNLGALHWVRGEDARAEPPLREALAMRRRLFPRDKFPDGHRDLAMTLDNLGGLLNDQKKYAEAEPLMREALAMRRRLFPKARFPNGHPDIAAGLNNLGSLLQARREYAQAEPLYREALELYRRLYPREKYPDGHLYLTICLNNLGVVLKAQGEYVQAETYYREALELYRRLYPREKYPDGHLYLTICLSTLSSLFQARGEYDKAEPLSREALDLLRRLYPREKYPDGHPDLADGVDDLAALLWRRGENAQAEALGQEALEMRRRLFPKDRFPNGHPSLSKSFGLLGAIAASRKEYDRAEAFMREDLASRRLYPKDWFPHGDPDLGTALNNLGMLLGERGEYDEAEPLLREVAELNRRLYPPKEFPQGHPNVAAGLNNLGLLFTERGDYAKAEPFYRDALDMGRRLYPPEKFAAGHVDLAHMLSNVGGLLLHQGEYAKAEPTLRDALRMYQGAALRYADAAAEAEALNYLASLPLTRDIYLSATRHLPAGPSAYELLWDGRAALTRLLERRHRDLLASRDDEARRLGRQLFEARQRLAYLLLHPARDPEEHRQEVQKRTDAKEDLERRLARQLRLAPPRNDPQQVTPKRLSELLPEGAAFVDLLRYIDMERDPAVPGKKGEKRAPRYVAFVLCRGRPPARIDLKEAAALDAAWAAWHQALTARRPDEPAERRAAAAFAELAWRPLRAALPADLRTVYLAAEGKLSQIPWGALPGKGPEAVLLDECAVCLVPHGPFLLERLEERAAPARPGDTLLAYGGIDYGQPPAAVVKGDDVRAPLLSEKRGGRWGALSGTDRERQQVAELAGKVLKDRPVTRSGRAASTAQLLEDLPKARYAHLATHGFFADPQFRSAFQVDLTLFDYVGRFDRRGGARSPLVLSGLVLAGADRQGEEAAPDRGILTAEGLVGLPLEHLELAVLSACETGLGEDGGGEGVYGLQRAFHVAGCRNVVASLWKVDDQATQALMALFYRNLWERKLDAAEALRQAQLALYRHPEAPALAAKRGADFTERELPKVQPEAAGPAKRSPAAHWAAFTFSGVRPAR
jgi:CHAT domain-containing protein/tetratricopeptide (TPR) repeat protein